MIDEQLFLNGQKARLPHIDIDVSSYKAGIYNGDVGFQMRMIEGNNQETETVNLSGRKRSLPSV